MMLKRFFLSIICLSLWAPASWAASVVDGSSLAAYQQSVTVMYEELSGNKQVLFGKAAEYYNAMFEWSVEAGKNDPEVRAKISEIMQDISGANVDTLIGTYIRVVETNYEMAKNELAEAKKYIANASEINQAISGFEIMDATFYFDESGGGNPIPMIGLAVHNGTSFTINHIYLRAKVHSKGRVIPWFEEEFNFGLREGLKKGATADWELMTDASAGWNTIPKRDDLEISLEIVKLVTADGRELNARPLPQKQDEYLNILADQIDIFRKELEELKKLAN